MQMNDLRSFAKSTPTWHQRFMKWMMIDFCVGALGLLSVACAVAIGSGTLQMIGTLVVGLAAIAGFLAIACMIPFAIIYSIKERNRSGNDRTDQ